MLAEAFELGRPIEPLAPYCFGSHENWTLGTMAGRFLVTRLWAGPDAPWRPELERAMEFERRACQAGIDMPRPIAPRTAAFGDAARVHGFGVFRIHEWVDHRPLGVDDDIAAWLGSTLARLHRLVPLDAPPQPRWYGLFPAQRWNAWLAEGEARGMAWAPALRDRLPDILEVSHWIADAFAKAGRYVVTHRDVQPANVLMSGSGPVLVDWDSAGPDSAPLETVESVLAFASLGRSEPDAATVRRALAAYAAGGHPIGAGRDLVARRVGLHLHRLTERLEGTLGGVDQRTAEPAQVEVLARQDLEEFPGLLATLTRWSDLLGA